MCSATERSDAEPASLQEDKIGDDDDDDEDESVTEEEEGSGASLFCRQYSVASASATPRRSLTGERGLVALPVPGTGDGGALSLKGLCVYRDLTTEREFILCVNGCSMQRGRKCLACAQVAAATLLLVWVRAFCGQVRAGPAEIGARGGVIVRDKPVAVVCVCTVQRLLSGRASSHPGVWSRCRCP